MYKTISCDDIIVVLSYNFLISAFSRDTSYTNMDLIHQDDMYVRRCVESLRTEEKVGAGNACSRGR